jgi:hypothetical protein
MTDGIAGGIADTLRAGGASYSVGALAVPGLRHFVYKSRSHVQITQPRFEEPYADRADQRRCVRGSGTQGGC